MPNIEIHGLNSEESIKVVLKLQNAFVRTPFQNDYVATVYGSLAVNHQGENQPFLRLVTTQDEHTKSVIEELQKLGFDLEVMFLDRFIPKKS